MDFTTKYPEYRTIEEHIRRARAERSVAVAHFIASIAERVVRGVRSFATGMGKGLQAEHERRMIEADSFLKRSIPHH
jgi:hypothetical protein